MKRNITLLCVCLLMLQTFLGVGLASVLDIFPIVSVGGVYQTSWNYQTVGDPPVAASEPAVYNSSSGYLGEYSLEFDLSGIAPGFESISLYVKRTGYGGSAGISLYGYNGNGSSELTDFSTSPASDYTLLAGPYSPNYSAMTDMDVKVFVTNLLNTSKRYAGFLLAANTNDPNGSVNFATNSFPSESFRPKLIVTYSDVPEPTTMLLLGLGLIGIAGMRRKMQR